MENIFGAPTPPDRGAIRFTGEKSLLKLAPPATYMVKLAIGEMCNYDNGI